MPEYRARDVALATYLRAQGVRNSLRIIIECRKTNGLVPVSLGVAVSEQETGHRNVWGHDRRGDGSYSGTPGAQPGQTVTAAAYRQYHHNRARVGNQGCGQFQLTSPGLQDQADEAGGCWVARHNIAVGIHTLAGHIAHLGRWDGVAAFNTGPGGIHTAAGRRYSGQVEARYKKWHRRLAGV